ncbi:MAG: ATP-binding protein [Myxococcota bacterium]
MPEPGASPNLDPRVASAVLRAAVDAIIVADRHGCIRQFNPAAEALFGWREAEVIGRGLDILMPHDVANAHAGYLRHHLDTGQTAIIGQGREVVAARRDGTSVDVNLSVSRFEIDGEPQFVGIIRDITTEVERRRRLQQLAEQLAQQSAISDARIALEVLTRSTRGVEDLANELLRAIAVCVGASAGVLYLARPGIAPVFEAIARLAVPPTMERFPDLVEAACSARQLRVVAGTAESLLVDASPGSVAAVPLLHYDEVIGAVELALPVDHPDLHSRLEPILPTVAGVLAARLDQQRIHSLLEHSRSQALELQQLNRKLDDRAVLLMEQQHALEEGHAELHRQTETLSKQRRELLATNTELEHARELAEERARELDTANRYKSHFLANMSHELRTPLNSILILARLLVEDDGERLDEDQIESARSIGSAGRDLLDLINDILDISRIEVGERRISPVRCDVEPSIRTLDRLFRPVAEERDLDFVVDLERELPARVVVDELRLHQILRNLLSNAFKFTDRGRVTLRVASGRAPDRITFVVSDTGVGIPPEAQTRIFRAFQQADGSLTRQHTGAGLGLAISRQLAERMGGTLELTDSGPGGSTFALDIPVGLPARTRDIPACGPTGPPHLGSTSLLASPIRSDVPRELPQPRRSICVERRKAEPVLEEPRPPPRHGFARRRVLLVDDDVRYVFALRQLLRHRQIEVLVAEDGAEALRRVEDDGPFDAILMDVMMPVMDGLEATRRLRARPSGERLFIMALTARAMPGDRERCLQAGASDYLAKPVDNDVLLRRLAAHFRTTLPHIPLSSAGGAW